MFLGIIITIAYSCLSGLVLSLVARLPRIWRTGQKGIILSISTTYLVAALCSSLLIIYIGILTTITSESYQLYYWDDFSKGEGGIGYAIDGKMHHNRDAIAAELWNRLMLPCPQKYCFTSGVTVCDLANRIESNRQISRRDTFSLTLSIVPSALTCIATTRHLIKRRTAEMQNPEQTAHTRRRKTYLVIPLLLIWSCLTLIPISGPVIGDLAINSAMAEAAHPVRGYDGRFQVIDYTDAPVIPGTTLWVGPWRSTLVPGIAIGLGVVVAIEGTLLAFFTKKVR